MKEENILCVSNNYEAKYYLNPRFENLPDLIKKELKIMCVLFTTRIGGLIILEFDEEFGELKVITEHNEEDILYDEIGSVLEARKLEKENAQLFEQLELYFKTLIAADIQKDKK